MSTEKVKGVRFAVGFRKVGHPKGSWVYVSAADGSGELAGGIPFPFLDSEKEAHTVAAKLAMRPDVCDVTVRRRTVTLPSRLVAN